MSVLVVGISHHTAPVALLERVAVDADGAAKLLRDVAAGEHVTRGDGDRHLQPARDLRRGRPLPRQRRGAVSRCWSSGPAAPPRRCCRTSTSTTTTAPSRTSSRSPPGSTRWWSARARSSARPARRCAVGQEAGTVGPALNSLFQQALRVGKRAHAETGIDRAAPSLVSAALDRVGGRTSAASPASGSSSSAPARWPAWPRPPSYAAGRRRGRRRQPHARPRRPGSPRSTAAARPPLADLADELAGADLVIACTGLGRASWSPPTMVAARSARRCAIVDLALPARRRPGVARLPGVTLVTLADLADDLRDSDGRRARSPPCAGSSAEEVAAFLAARRQASVTPTVVALRTMATEVVDAELARLATRLPDLDEASRAEVLHSRAPGRRQAAPPADRAGQGAGQRDRRGVLRRRAAPSCSPSTPTRSTPSRRSRPPGPSGAS